MLCPRCLHDNVPGADVCERCQFDLAPLDRPTATDRVESTLMDDRVQLLEPRPPVTVTADATVGDAVRHMIERSTGAVLVVDGAGKLVGILTERDLMLKLDPGGPFEGRPVSEFYTPDPATVAPTDSLAFCLHKMDVGGYRHLPVVSDGRPVGVVSVRDLIRHITTVCRGDQ